MIFTEYVPYDTKGLGYAYNACAASCNTEWVAFRDSDVMLLGNYGHLIEQILRTHGQRFDLFTCVTNRISNPAQQATGIASPERDLVKLYELQKARFEKFGTNVLELTTPIAGYFLLFRRTLWQEIPFPLSSNEPGARPSPKILGIDTTWTRSVLAARKKIGLIRGLCAIHYYRMHCTNRYDCSHLIKRGFIYQNTD
jgi:hypothetical protein